MTVLSRLEKLEEKLKPEKKKVYFMGWASCEYKQSNGLTRMEGESKKDFCNRVYQTTKKQFLWFD
jgi:hypothetical protein